MHFLDYSFWSIIPPLLTIFLVIKTREVILSMSIGIALGCFLLADLNPLGALETFVEMLIGSPAENGTLTPGAITETDNMLVLLSMVMIGALIGLLVKSGASRAFANYLGHRVNTKKRTGIMASIVGTLLLIDDYFDSLTNGAIMKEISDKNKVPREKLAYYLDSTTYAVCQISPISSWVAFIASLLAAGMMSAGIEGNAYQMLLKSIPYNFFAILSLIMVYLVATFGINLGAMGRAEKRADKTGKLIENPFGGEEEDAYAGMKLANGKPRDLIIPVVVLICLVLGFMMYTGGFFEHHNISQTIGQMEGIRSMSYGFVVTILFTMVYMRIRKVGTAPELVSAAFVGVKSVLYAVFVLSLGWTLGNIAEGLGTADFMISVFQGNIPPAVTPAILFLICAAMTFAIGGGWTTFAIMIPIVVPFTVATGADLSLCLTAVIGGSGLGATCSPLADTSIVASTAAEISIIDHIKTQLPYSLICGAIALIGYLVTGFSGSLLIGYVVVAALFIAAVIVMKKKWGASERTTEKENLTSAESSDIVFE